MWSRHDVGGGGGVDQFVYLLPINCARIERTVNYFECVREKGIAIHCFYQSISYTKNQWLIEIYARQALCLRTIITMNKKCERIYTARIVRRSSGNEKGEKVHRWLAAILRISYEMSIDCVCERAHRQRSNDREATILEFRVFGGGDGGCGCGYGYRPHFFHFCYTV